MKRFTSIQISLHWLTLLIIAVAYTTIEIKGYFEDDYDQYNLIKTIHYNAGILVWVCVAIRIVLRHKNVSPPVEPPMNQWQQRLATLMHIALYFCFFAMPILGVLVQFFNGAHWSLFGVIEINGLSPAIRSVGRVMKSIHETLGNIGYYLIGLHAAAALFHHYIQKDNTLLRMLPSCFSRRQ